MNILFYLLIFVVIAGIVGIVRTFVTKKRDESEINISSDIAKEEYFKNMLVSGEYLEACVSISSSNKYYCAATNQRLLIEDRNGLHSIPYGNIQKVKLKDFGANKTRRADNVMIAYIYADQKYSITRCSAKFVGLMESIIAHNSAVLK